jgi:hypothetical protein
MCTYTTHIRICARCAREETVLISEQLCLVAKASGIFGSCLDGVFCQRDATGYRRLTLSVFLLFPFFLGLMIVGGAVRGRDAFSRMR